jgi:DNA-binding MarR family transcriptional regulator
MTEISNKMGHSTAAATGLVDRLEKLGYVQRLHAADDRRKVMVQITRKGMDLVGRMRDGIALNIAETMSKMDSHAAPESATSLDQLSDLLMQGR